MSNRKSLTKDEIVHLAVLAKLELSDNEVEKLRSQLEETIDYIENLNELDTTGTEPTNSVVDLKNITFEDGEKNKKGLTQKEALQNAKKTKEGKFVVERIM